jgi:hypothetical protein
MTVLVGVETFAGCAIGSDNQMIASWVAHPVPGGKLVAKGDFIVACSGSMNMLDVLRHRWDVPPYVETDSIEKFIAVDFVDSVRAAMRDAGLMYSLNGVEQFRDNDNTNNNMIVACRGRLFGVWGDFSISTPIDGLMANGSGWEFAYGAMWAATKVATDFFRSDPMLIARIGIDAAIRFNAGCGGDAVVRWQERQTKEVAVRHEPLVPESDKETN